MSITILIIVLVVGIGIGIGIGVAVASRKRTEINTGIVGEQAQQKEKNIQKIREFLRGRETIANNDVERLLGVSDDTAWRYLNELEKEGVVEQIGERGRFVTYRLRK